MLGIRTCSTYRYRGRVDRDLGVLDEQLKLRYTLETHLHGDHVTGANRLRDRTGCEVIVTLGSSVEGADREVRHGDTVTVGAQSFRVLSTPGHTSGCVTYFMPEAGIAFTGDALLVRGCGRTDYADGDSTRLYRSVHDQIFTLPDETTCPHDYKGEP